MESLLGLGNKLLRDTIRNQNHALAIELENLWNAAQRKIHQFQEGKTSQGTLHCVRVEENIGLLLQDSLDKFKDVDLFLLSAAAALHDIGRIKHQVYGTQLDHGQWGRKLLLDRDINAEFFQEQRKATAVAEIIGVHDNGRISDLPEEPFVIGSPPGVLLRSLAAIFRLADMLDTDYRRCPYVLQGIKSLAFVENPEVWIARESIGGWDGAKDGKTILLQLSSKEEEDRKIATACVDILNETITESQRKYLENCPTLYWDKGAKSGIVHLPFRFQLDTSQLERGLQDLSQLYIRAKNDYLKSLAWGLSEVDLDGLGEFADKRPTKLDRVFIDVKARLASEWKSRKVIDESEKLRQMRERGKLKLGRMTMLQRILEEPAPFTSIPDSGEFSRIVILGEPGSGKSTILQYICLKCAHDQEPIGEHMSDIERELVRPIPFLIVIRELVAERKRRRGRYSIMDYLIDEVNSHLRRRCPEGFVQYYLTGGRALILFDGLDEVLQSSQREKIRKEIMHFIGVFQEARYIITSRIVGYEQNALDPEVFVHLMLMKLDSDQIDDFIERWYRQREHDPRTCRARIESLRRAIKDPDVGQIASNPLLLTIMTLVHKAEADLPRQKVLLYDRCVQAFLVNRDRAKNLLSYDENEIRACHEYLAYQMQNKLVYAEIGIRELSEMLVSFFSERWPVSLEMQKRKVEEFIDTSRKRVGIIVERGPGVFAFGHRSFQEYFAACYLTSRNYGISELWASTSDKIFSPHWHETIKLLAGRLGCISSRGLDQFIDKLLEINPMDYGGSLDENVILAGEIAAEKVPMSGNTLIRICDKVIDLWWHTEYGSPLLIKRGELIRMLREGAAGDYVFNRLREIHRRQDIFDSRKRRLLHELLSEETTF